MTTPLPSRLRESAKAMKSLDSVSLRPSTLALIDRESAVRIAAELTDAADALEAGPWMPIETAPKDGTMFLCWVSAVRYGETDEGQRYQEEVSQIDFCQWRTQADIPDCGWFEPFCGQIGDEQDVTLWAPLPVAPGAQVAQEGGGVATDGALSPHAAALTVDTVLERLDFMAGHEASAIVRDTAEAAAAMIRAARGVATDGGDDAREP